MSDPQILYFADKETFLKFAELNFSDAEDSVLLVRAKSVFISEIKVFLNE